MTTIDDITIEPGRENDLDRCACCGAVTRIVRGVVYRAGTARAVYLVRWAVGQSSHDADLAVSVGGWCDADESPRVWVALALRQTENGPAFMIIDAQNDKWGDEDLLGEPKSRSEVVGTTLASEVFRILDAVALQDMRLSGWHLN
jgi:hypothetical protein